MELRGLIGGASPFRSFQIQDLVLKHRENEHGEEEPAPHPVCGVLSRSRPADRKSVYLRRPLPETTKFHVP